ncbi:MAG: hypothetical protein ABIK07_25480 [Planctomycetota bacterium]
MIEYAFSSDLNGADTIVCRMTLDAALELPPLNERLARHALERIPLEQ